jgi:hypothetical protein
MAKEITPQVPDEQVPDTTVADAAAPVADSPRQGRLDFDDFDDVPDDLEDAGTTAAEGETATETAAPGNALLERLRGFGIDAADEQAALQALTDRYEQTSGYMQQLQEHSRVAEERFNQAMSLLARNQAPESHPAAPTPPATQESPWRKVKPMNVPQELLKMYRTPEGSFKPDTPEPVLMEAYRYQQDSERAFLDLIEKPDEVLGPGVRAIVEEMLQERLTSHDRQRDTRTQLERMSDEVSRHLYAVNPTTGQPDQNLFSDYGRTFAQAQQQIEQTLRSIGREPTREEVFVLAYNQTMPLLQQLQGGQAAGAQAAPVAPQVPAAPQQPLPKTPEEIRAEQRRKHTQGRAAGVPGAGGTTTNNGGQARPARKQNPMLNVGSEFAEAFFS